MNVLDRFIANISPSSALKRKLARQRLEFLNTGYSHYGASKKKKSMKGWKADGGSTKEDIDDNLQLLHERSRDLYMGVPLATGALKTIRTNTVGSGLKLKAQIDGTFLNMSETEADEWEALVQREFALWADTPHCDAMRFNNFYQLQQLSFLSYLMSGECFVLLPYIERPNIPYDLRVQLLEADRVCTPNGKERDKSIINGVKVGDYGEIIAYYIAKQHPLSSDKGKMEWFKVDAYGEKTGCPNILHLAEFERPEQRRGIPILAPVIESLKQLGRYTDAELIAAVVSGMFTVFVTSEYPENEDLYDENVEDEDLVDKGNDLTQELGPGAMITLGEGESMTSANPGRPNSAFDGFVTSICRQIGAALELPYEMLVKHFTASYSASRGALLEAWKMFKMKRTFVASKFCQPIYEEFLAEGIAKGRIYAPGFFEDSLVRKAYCGAEWNGPSQGQLDPLKEVKAASERVNNSFSSRSRETTELTGGDFGRIVRQRKSEEKLMKEIGGNEDA